MKLPESSEIRKRLKKPVTVRYIQGHSMMPVLPPGTLVYGTGWFWKLRPGNIVIFFHNGKEKIKRVDQVRDGKVYLLGDHAETSTDSRHFGWLDIDTVIAKVLWPRAPKHRAEGVETE